MDKVVVIVDLHTFHQVKFVLNGHAKVFDISERSRRYFDRQCRDDLNACLHVSEESSYETLRNNSYRNAIKAIGEWVTENARKFAMDVLDELDESVFKENGFIYEFVP
jgi:hypothetical protein